MCIIDRELFKCFSRYFMNIYFAFSNRSGYDKVYVVSAIHRVFYREKNMRVRPCVRGADLLAVY